MIARWTGHIEAGTLSDHVGYFGDVMATIAELMDEPLPHRYPDSLSFLPTLLGKPQPQHPYLYWNSMVAASILPPFGR